MRRNLLSGGCSRRKREGTCPVCDRIFDDFLFEIQAGKPITAEIMQGIDPIYKVKLIEFICLRAVDEK